MVTVPSAISFESSVAELYTSQVTSAKKNELRNVLEIFVSEKNAMQAKKPNNQ